jgi:4'-phosphopantetheinyl transferase
VTAQFTALLSADERERAARFAFAHLRRSFTLARGALRILLGRTLGMAPAAIRFVYGEKGKPGLAEPGRVRFNMSHSGELALIAIGLDCELGVDIERIRPLPDLQEIAARFFSREEETELMALPEDLREAAFFRCWTRKEAYIKAIGDGLSAPLDGFAVSLRDGEPARMIQIGGDAAAAGAWRLHHLDVEPGYVAALAYRGERHIIRVSPPADPAPLFDL